MCHRRTQAPCGYALADRRTRPLPHAFPARRPGPSRPDRLLAPGRRGTARPARGTWLIRVAERAGPDRACRLSRRGPDRRRRRRTAPDRPGPVPARTRRAARADPRQDRAPRLARGGVLGRRVPARPPARRARQTVARTLDRRTRRLAGRARRRRRPGAHPRARRVDAARRARRTARRHDGGPAPAPRPGTAAAAVPRRGRRRCRTHTRRADRRRIARLRRARAAPAARTARLGRRRGGRARRGRTAVAADRAARPGLRTGR